MEMKNKRIKFFNEIKEYVMEIFEKYEGDQDTGQDYENTFKNKML